ncbi:Endonuclease/exonuclease/phosphatase, partial [Lenzites betulinus]
MGPAPSPNCRPVGGAITISYGVIWSLPVDLKPTANNQLNPNNHTDEINGNGRQSLDGARCATHLATVQNINEGPSSTGSGPSGEGGSYSERAGTSTEDGRAPKHTRARLKLGTLNIKGFGVAAVDGTSNKWLYINQVIRDKKLDVLAVQETHLTEERLEAINKLFPSIRVFATRDPSNETAAKGVAVVVNLRRLAGRECKIYEVVQGRAMMVQYPWTPNKNLNILAVYAPNRTSENASFWETLQKWEGEGNDSIETDVMLGDFNVVESALDRYPPRADVEQATEALSLMLKKMKLVDAWRRAHPGVRQYTFAQAGTERQSRLDRIYVRELMLQSAAGWEVTGAGLMSDHQLVQMSLANYHAPAVGKGRWAAPLALLDDKIYVDRMRGLGTTLQREMDALGERTAERNPQKLFHDFKVALAKEARERTKQWVPKLEKKIRTMREQVITLQNDETKPVSEHPEIAETVALLQE